MTDSLWGDEPPGDAAEFVGRLWRVGREAADKKKQVVQAARDAGHGKTRDQLRVVFEDELARQDIPADPIWVEQKLDELEWSPGERARQTTQRPWLAGGTLTRMARSHGIPETPGWMQPPEEATFRMWAPGREKTSVEIDPRAAVWLERVLTNAPGRVGELLALIDVWFDWDADAEEGTRVTVHMGTEMVGCSTQVPQSVMRL
jgi:hypothetical protein